MFKYILGQIVNSSLFLFCFYLLLNFTNIQNLIIISIIAISIALLIMELNRLLFVEGKNERSGENIFLSTLNIVFITATIFVFSLLLKWFPSIIIPLTILIVIVSLLLTFSIFKSEFPSYNNFQKSAAGVLAMIQTSVIWYGMLIIYASLRS